MRKCRGKKKTQKLPSNSIHISVLGGLRLVIKGTKKKKKKNPTKKNAKGKSYKTLS